MGYNYELTHEKILENARELFLKNGYERTNLRQICSASGVTNGAFYRHFKSKADLFSILVEPCVKEFDRRYLESEGNCYDALSKEGVTLAMEISNEMIISLIDYIYDHFDSFKLLLMRSGGTPYERFVERIVVKEVKETTKFFKAAVDQGINIEVPNEKSIHMLSHCYFNTIFECVVHEYDKEETLEEVSTLVAFFNAGWKTILGLH